MPIINSEKKSPSNWIVRTRHELLFLASKLQLCFAAMLSKGKLPSSSSSRESIISSWQIQWQWCSQIDHHHGMEVRSGDDGLELENDRQRLIADSDSDNYSDMVGVPISNHFCFSHIHHPVDRSVYNQI